MAGALRPQGADVSQQAYRLFDVEHLPRALDLRDLLLKGLRLAPVSLFVDLPQDEQLRRRDVGGYQRGGSLAAQPGS